MVTLITPSELVNPRRACAARVTVYSCFVILPACLSVCLLPRFLPLRAPIGDTNGFSATLALFLKYRVFFVNAALESYGVKQSEGANMQISAGLPRPALCTWEVPEVAMQNER